MTMKQKLILTLILLAAAPMLISTVTSTILAKDIAASLLIEQAREKLISVRELKKSHIEDFYESIHWHIATFAKNGSVTSAAIQLGESFYQYGDQIDSHNTRDERAGLKDYYQNEFGPKYKLHNPGKSIDTARIIDSLTDEEALMQARFISQNPNPLGSKHLLDKTNDASSYSKQHGKFHPQFRDVLEKFGYYDIFIVHPTTGDVIYSVFKELDFATSLINGPYANTGLGEAYRSAAAATDPEYYHITDFTQYPPSYEDPAAFISAPIFDHASSLVGVIIFQLPAATINNIMTSGQDWEAVGLGKTGETILIGKDQLMRSSSRFLLEEPEKYAKDMVSKGLLTLDEANEMVVKGTSVTLQSVDTVGVQKALNNETGFDIFKDYRGVQVLSAYSKLDIQDLDWYIFSEMDEAEAYAPATILSEKLSLYTLGIATVMLTLAVLLGWRFAARLTAPITLLEIEIGEIEASSDLTRRLYSHKNDVTVGIVGSLNKMFEKLHRIVNKVAVNSQSMEDAANNVKKVSAETSQSIHTQSAETDRMAESMQQIVATVAEVASNAEDADAAAKEANDQAVQGNQIVLAASNSINDLAKDILHTSEVITRLAEDSENIGGVLDVIRSIAEQTNLLALNAAIEAARAGEHGRGFAVVSDEVRTLASRTQEATAEIQSMIERLQSGTHDAVTSMKKGRQQAEVSVTQASEASDALQKITDSIADITQMNSNITSASTKQRGVADEVSDSIRNITSISADTIEGAGKTEEASVELTELTVELRHSVQEFKFGE